MKVCIYRTIETKRASAKLAENFLTHLVISNGVGHTLAVTEDEAQQIIRNLTEVLNEIWRIKEQYAGETKL